MHVLSSIRKPLHLYLPPVTTGGSVLLLGGLSVGLFICRSVTQNSPDLLEIKTKMLWYLFDLERSRSNQGRKDCENGEIVSGRNSAANSPIYFKYRPQYSSLSGSVCLLGGEGNLRPRRPPREYLGEYTS